MVPEGWSLVDANRICESISVGVVIKPSQYYVDESVGIKAFRSANVREGFINDSDWVYFSQEGHLANKKSQLKTGDVLIVRTGYPGTACVVTPEFEGANAIDIVIARPKKDKVLPEYLCAYTNSSVGKSQVLSLQGGMAQKHLNVSAYQTLKVKLPPLSEQRQITQILSTWEKAISITEKLLVNSQQKKKAIMQQLLTGKKRFEGFNREWSKVKVSDMGSIFSGGTPDTTETEYWNGGISWLTPTDVTSLKSRYVFNTNKTISEKGLKNSSAKMLPKGALLVCTRATIGAMAISATEITTNQGFKNLVPNSDFSVEFLYYLFMFNVKELVRKSSGSTFLELSKSDFEKITFLCPCLDEQHKIASALTTVDNVINVLQQKLDYLKQEKKALMQQLLTGKLRVKMEAV
ncbi:restriction endonuclease subunit S [Klebsiella sp. CN_Kp088]|uniref:restriction endonuclease subunit S n=1 Tax=Klebsiella sp. CN_Kp088 TaxID=3153415 RepID=UPI0032B47529